MPIVAWVLFGIEKLKQGFSLIVVVILMAAVVAIIVGTVYFLGKLLISYVILPIIMMIPAILGFSLIFIVNAAILLALVEGGLQFYR